MQKSVEVDAYLEAVPFDRQAPLTTIRELVHETIPMEIIRKILLETVKRQTQD